MKKDVKVNFIFSENMLTLVFDGEVHTITDVKLLKEFKKVLIGKKTPDIRRLQKLIAVNKKSFDEIAELFKKTDPTASYDKKTKTLTYKGFQIKNALVNKIVDTFAAKGNVYPVVLFFEKLMENPSDQSRLELFDFMEVNSLPLTENGNFLAYKVVRPDYFDKYTRTMDNSIGKTVEMKREDVNPDRHTTCSYGLHFCSKQYVEHYFSQGDRIVVLEINPKDVVSIPVDYNNSKGRCCKYTVYGEIEMENTIVENFFKNNSSLVKEEAPLKEEIGVENKYGSFDKVSYDSKECLIICDLPAGEDFREVLKEASKKNVEIEHLVKDGYKMSDVRNEVSFNDRLLVLVYKKNAERVRPYYLAPNKNRVLNNN